MSTIAAISTAPANGGIGIIRMSGKKCFEILDKIFIPKQKQNIEDIPGYSIKYGYIIDFNTKQKIDETENLINTNTDVEIIYPTKILHLFRQCAILYSRYFV